MSTPTPLRVGLIGYGLAGSVFHAPLIAATAGLKLAAIVTSDRERAAQAKARHPDALLIADRETLWQQALDLVVIASPNRSHAPLAMRALQAGIAVVVDKPLAVTAADAQLLVDTARQHEVLLSVFHNRRWDGDFLTLQQLLRDDRLGSVQRFESRFERWRPQPRAGWRQFGDAADGGGVLLDLGSHLIDQAVQLFGPVHSVYAELDCRHPQAAVEDDAFVALTHASGTRSHLWMSSMAADSSVRMRVLGSKGAYVKHGLDGQEDALRSGMRADDPAFGREDSARWGQLSDGVDVSAIATAPGQWSRFYADIEHALRCGSLPAVRAEEAVCTLHLCEAARRSAELGRCITVAAHSGRAMD